MVKLYSTPSCSICKQAEKDMLSRGISYQKINVEESSLDFEKMFAATGNLNVPQFNIRGEWVIGYHRGILDKMTISDDDFDLGSLANEKFEQCVNCEG